MSKKYKKSLGRSLSVGCVVFFLILCAVLSVVNQVTYRKGLLNRYRSNIKDILYFTRSQIDTDDLAECIRLGVKSEKYNQLQNFMDALKDNVDVHFLYIIRPLNKKPENNVMDIIAAMSTYEKEYAPDNRVSLNGLTGPAYSVDSVSKYLKAAETSEISFFVSDFVKGSSYLDYTGALPLYTSTGKYIGLLCADIDIATMKGVVYSAILQNILSVVVLGLIFILLFIIWINANIVNPIHKLENVVTRFAYQHEGKENVDSIVLENPDIHTGNEIESLSDSIVKMSKDMHDYAVNAIEVESRIRELSELANKDTLTSVRNKTAYDNYEESMNEKIAGGFTEFAVAMVDLNFLKKINDTYGHERGNDYIKLSCSVICHIFTHSPVFRIGGDEFVIILKGEDFKNREALYKEVLDVFKTTSGNMNVEPWQRLSVSIGIADFDANSDKNMKDVMNRADNNMYEHKKALKAVRYD